MLELLVCGINTKSATVGADNYNPAQGAMLTFTVLTSGISKSERIYWSVTSGAGMTGLSPTSGSGYQASGKLTFTLTIPYNSANNLKAFTVGVGLTAASAASATDALGITQPITVQKLVEQVGQQLYANVTLTTTFTVPARTTNLSMVCVGRGTGGGGGLGYRTSVAVTPGEVLNIIIDGTSSRVARGTTVLCAGNAATFTNGGYGGKSAASVNDGGGNGGNQANVLLNGNHVLCGGGAGGYSGNGGTATSATATTGTPGTGGGGGSGYSSSSTTVLYQAGGVGVLGAGANGAGGAAGSGGSGRNYGGGTTIIGSTYTSSNGAIRIIWGPNRAYPSTGTADQTTVK